MKRLCLHICCAPCSTIPHKILSEKFQVEGFFYNPNIHPEDEYLKRKETLEKYSNAEKFNVTYSKHNPDEFFKAVGPKKEKEERCRICWRLRMEETAKFAKENNFDSFSTTLLISPYQDNDYIKTIGFDIAKKFGIDYIHQDFRPYYKESRLISKEKNLYRQNFCGCIYSLEERLEKVKKKASESVP